LDTRRRAWRTPIGDVGSIFESGAPLTIGLWDYVLRSHVDFNFRAQPTLAPATGPQGYVTWLCHVVRTLSESDGINRERRAGSRSRQSPAAGDGPIEGDGRIKEVSDLGPPARARRQPLWARGDEGLLSSITVTKHPCQSGAYVSRRRSLPPTRSPGRSRCYPSFGRDGLPRHSPAGKGGDLIATYCQMHGCVSAKTAIKLNRRSRIAPTPGSRSGAVPPGPNKNHEFPRHDGLQFLH